jgi:hypothetical protein
MFQFEKRQVKIFYRVCCEQQAVPKHTHGTTSVSVDVSKDYIIMKLYNRPAGQRLLQQVSTTSVIQHMRPVTAATTAS